MATLVLNSVGNAIGGPLGGAVGALLGNQIDRRLFGADRREGPRLGDLAVQGASYGAPIPAIFGRMRVAGTIIWATELKESETVSGAKGQPEQVTFSYAANFALLLSSRATGRVGRIWADGRLLRGEAGDLKVGGSLRIMTGAEDQTADPLIASIETDPPAYRGRFCLVFEGLELAEYGNRIPLITVEMIADDAISLGQASTEMSDGLVRCESPESLDGYAFYGTNVRTPLLQLLELHGIALAQVEGRLIEAQMGVPARDIDRASLVVDDGEEQFSAQTAPAASLPAVVDLDYYDASRDYQAGRASARGVGGREAVQVDAPLVLGADRARAMAERLMRDRWIARRRATFHLPIRAQETDPVRVGSIVSVGGETGRWRVEAVEYLDGRMRLDVVQVAGIDATRSVPSDAGRSLPSPDRIASPTRLEIVELPDLDGTRQANMLVATANSSEGWRPVPVEMTVGGLHLDGSSAARESVLGISSNVLRAVTSCLIDQASELTIDLVDPSHHLVSVDDAALLSGANLAMVGDELIQFGRAEAIGGGRYRLTRLLRGRRGTEWAAYTHRQGEVFLLLDPSRTVAIELRADQIGASFTARPAGLADGDAQPVARTVAGAAFRPVAPTHLRMIERDGGIDLSWIARDRNGFAWNDHSVDRSIGEIQLFEIHVAGAQAERRFETVDSMLHISTDDVAAVGARPWRIEVRALGDVAASRPTTLIIE